MKIDQILPPAFVRWFLLPVMAFAALIPVVDMGAWFVWVFAHLGSK